MNYYIGFKSCGCIEFVALVNDAVDLGLLDTTGYDVKQVTSEELEAMDWNCIKHSKGRLDLLIEKVAKYPISLEYKKEGNYE